MASSSKKNDKSDVEQAVDQIKTTAKVAAYGLLSGVAIAARVVSDGAATVKVAVTDAREGLTK